MNTDETNSNLENRIQKLEQEIALVKERNKKVENNKAWEISLTRAISILITTYIVAAITLWSIGTTNYLLGAIIPTLGYYLSTLSLPFIKRWWIKNCLK